MAETNNRNEDTEGGGESTKLMNAEVQIKNSKEEEGRYITVSDHPSCMHRMGTLIGRKLKIRNEYAREFLAEFLGTFILIVFGDGSVAQFVLSKGSAGSPVTVYWSWGIGVMMGIYVAGGVSGGHLNPAVTVAQAILGRCPWRKVPIYMAGQYCGSFCASFFVFIIYIDALNNFDGGIRMVEGATGTAGIWATYPQSHVSIMECVGDQIFGTAILLICVLAVTDDRNMNPNKGLIPVCVGFIVFAIGMTYGYNCGYAINPARDLAPRIFTAVAGWGTDPFSHRDYAYFWIPVLCTHLGAIIGSFIYMLFVGLHWPDTYEVTSDNAKDKQVIELKETH